MSFDQLNYNLLSEVVKYLSLKDILRLRQVNQNLNRFTRRDDQAKHIVFLLILETFDKCIYLCWNCKNSIYGHHIRRFDNLSSYRTSELNTNSTIRIHDYGNYLIEREDILFKISKMIDQNKYIKLIFIFCPKLLKRFLLSDNSLINHNDNYSYDVSFHPGCLIDEEKRINYPTKSELEQMETVYAYN